MKTKTKLPRKFSPIFWDVYVKDIDLEKNAQFVMERILGFGDAGAIQWIRDYYSDKRIKEYLIKRGYKILLVKQLEHLRVLLNISREEWMLIDENIPTIDWRGFKRTEY